MTARLSRATDNFGYRTPVYPGYFADPFVLKTADGYVAYGTGAMVDGRAFQVLASADLVHWHRLSGALELLPPELGSDYWAPEVVVMEGRFWLYYSVGHGDRGHHIRVAVADKAVGPFVDQGVDLTPDELFAIDPNPFQDVDGRWYLCYARDVLDGQRVGTSLAVDELTAMTRLAGAPTAVLTPTADWQIYERGRLMYGRTLDWHTLEGPCVARRQGRYYLLYSGGSWQEPTYAVSWAVADHPRGPWREAGADAARLLQTVPGELIGPGHNCVTTGLDGGELIVYHAWDRTRVRRQMYIEPLSWTSTGPRLG